jgi:hypothetical protein
LLSNAVSIYEKYNKIMKILVHTDIRKNCNYIRQTRLCNNDGKSQAILWSITSEVEMWNEMCIALIYFILAVPFVAVLLHQVRRALNAAKHEYKKLRKLCS